MAEEISENLFEKVMEVAREVYRREGIDPDTLPLGVLESAVIRVLQEWQKDIEARGQEITDEEWQRIIDEEFDRLVQRHPETKTVPEEELHEAVIKRIDKEYGYLIQPRPGRRP
jgi:hypothetical protein